MVNLGIAPISPSSHKKISSLVKEYPELNDKVYKKVNGGFYISINEFEMLFEHWNAKADSALGIHGYKTI